MLKKNNKKRKFKIYSSFVSKQTLKASFLNGIARGLGNAIGFSILGAILIIVLQKLATSNLPLIGNFIADIVKIVEYKIK